MRTDDLIAELTLCVAMGRTRGTLSPVRGWRRRVWRRVRECAEELAYRLRQSERLADTEWPPETWMEGVPF